MELTALKHADKTSTTTTDEKLFGSCAQFKKGILKEARAKSKFQPMQKRSWKAFPGPLLRT